MNNYPKNVAIIMDGNRRWSEKNKKDLNVTYNIGARNLKNIIQKSSSLNIEQLTAFAFSTENWNREKYEIDIIFRLLEKFIKSEMAEMNKNNIKFKLIGDKVPFKDSLVKIINRAENLTANNTGLSFNLAFNYGGEMDIVNSFTKIFEKLLISKTQIPIKNLDIIKENLLSSSVNDIDLLIRTGGEQRISNFMLLQLSYSEFFFSDINWPDFNSSHFEKALKSFSKRKRRFGSSKNHKSGHRKITSL